MDVTAEILQNHLIYGASDNTNPAGLSSSRSLNYAAGPSITRPDNVRVTLIPYTLKYQDSVGLFGAENYFVKIDVALNPIITAKCFEEPGWECAQILRRIEKDNGWQGAVIDETKDLVTVNTYEPAFMKYSLNKLFKGYLSINLKNLKTGNIYIDSWLDTRLYTAEREEHPYDKMYIRENDSFYIGFHARNTRRLPYNVECLIGQEYISEDDIPTDERRYIARRIS